MTISKFKRACIMGMCITAMSSGAVFASTPKYEILPIRNIEIGAENTALSQKHREIDTYLFKENSKEIEARGFKVIYTGPREDYIEIGILPFNQENADFLYELFGKDMVKVVGGEEAYILPIFIEKDPGVIPIQYNPNIKNMPISNAGVRLLINSQWIEADVAPFIENSRTMVPVRGVMEQIGAVVEWDADNMAVNVASDGINIRLTIGNDIAKITKNVAGVTIEEEVKLDVAATIVEGRTFVPARFVAETLGARVDWDATNNVVSICTEENNLIIGIERPVNYEIIQAETIENQQLIKWYEENHKNEGIYQFTEGKLHYVLVAGGERSTGGYEMKINSITQVSEKITYIDAQLITPAKDDFVTQAITYPHTLVRFEKPDNSEVMVDVSEVTPGEIIVGEIGPSLEEMGKSIKLDAVKEMKMFSLMQQELKIFSNTEIKDIIEKLNTSPTYNGPILMMLAGNSVTIKLEGNNSIQLTSYGNEEHVIVSGEIDGEHFGYCVVNSEVGRLLLDK